MRNLLEKRANLLKGILFSLFFLLLINPVIETVFSNGTVGDRYREVGLHSEKEGMLDAILIGGSNVFEFFCPPLVWETYGVAIYPYAFGNMPIESIKYRIIEARKTQPDALYIIQVNAFRYDGEISDQTIHWSVNYMPFSKNKVDMTLALVDAADKSFFESLEFFFPIIRFHSRWDELLSSDFVKPTDIYKGSSIKKTQLTNVVDLSKKVVVTSETASIDKRRQAVLDDLIDFIRSENVNVLFVTAPQILPEKSVKELNGINAYLEELGFQVLDLSQKSDEMDLQPATDFYDIYHTNIHGAIKYTGYLADCLVEKYGFSDKRNLPGYESWNQAVTVYHQRIAPYTFDFEYRREPRDHSLLPPDLVTVKGNGLTSDIQWAPVENADGYVLYRKGSLSSENKNVRIAEFDKEILEFHDEKLKNGRTYTYTVVPFRMIDGKMTYGEFNTEGITVKISK